jgi:hypothetical protein
MKPFVKFNGNLTWGSQPIKVWQNHSLQWFASLEATTAPSTACAQSGPCLTQQEAERELAEFLNQVEKVV